MQMYVPPRCTRAPTSLPALASAAATPAHTGCAMPTWATIPSPKNAPARRRGWSETRPGPGGVGELTGDDQLERMDPLLHAPHRADGHEGVGAQRLHAVDVGPVVELGRREAVAAAVSWQGDHSGALGGAPAG